MNKNINWKPISYNYNVPKNTPPNLNSYSSFGKANPYRHWRKQLTSHNTNGNVSKIISIDAVNGPGVVTLNNSCNCVDEKNNLSIQDDIHDKNYKNTLITRSGKTNLDKTYFSSNSKYLQNRNKTYNKNLTNVNNSCCNKIIYKRNNTNYSKQGAVSSSNRLDKLKYDTIQKSASSLKIKYGSGAAKAASYKGKKDEPQIFKTNNYVENIKYCC